MLIKNRNNWKWRRKSKKKNAL